MTTKNIDLKAKELKELQIMADELNAEIEAIKDELKQEMSNRNVDELVTFEYKIRYKEVTNSRFDSKSFKAKYEELYNQFVKTTTSKRFSIA